MSSKTTEWNTPQIVVDRLNLMGHVKLDPCWNENCLIHADEVCTIKPFGDYVYYNGLLADWVKLSKDGLIYCNPPYGKELKVWADKISKEQHKVINLTLKGELICLLPARTDTRWFLKITTNTDVMCFVKSRLKFLNSYGIELSSAPFPSVITYTGYRPNKFIEIFGDIGWMAKPLN